MRVGQWVWTLNVNLNLNLTHLHACGPVTQGVSHSSLFVKRQRAFRARKCGCMACGTRTRRRDIPDMHASSHALSDYRKPYMHALYEFLACMPYESLAWMPYTHTCLEYIHALCGQLLQGPLALHGLQFPTIPTMYISQSLQYILPSARRCRC